MGKTWGIIPAAGNGTRIQPLAFSKELLPVGTEKNGSISKPRAISEYLISRMEIGKVTNICIVMSPSKTDLIKYFSEKESSIHFCYTIQRKPHGLCDAIFKAVPVINESDSILVGLPDTVWFPEDGFNYLEENSLSLLLFPVSEPEKYDAVSVDVHGRVDQVFVKTPGVQENWVWGAFKMSFSVYKDLYNLWNKRNRNDEYFGTLVNQYIKEGGIVTGVKNGTTYIDTGTLDGYQSAIKLLYEKECGLKNV